MRALHRILSRRSIAMLFITSGDLKEAFQRGFWNNQYRICASVGILKAVDYGVVQGNERPSRGNGLGSSRRDHKADSEDIRIVASWGGEVRRMEEAGWRRGSSCGANVMAGLRGSATDRRREVRCPSLDSTSLLFSLGGP
jgi:hypothetical protein